MIGSVNGFSPSAPGLRYAPIPGPCTLAWQGVTVPQYASQMVERYLHHEYDQDRRMNLEIAAREMYGKWLGERAECAGGIAA